jgi:hypothetical protein
MQARSDTSRPAVTNTNTPTSGLPHPAQVTQPPATKATTNATKVRFGRLMIEEIVDVSDRDLMDPGRPALRVFPI